MVTIDKQKKRSFLPPSWFRPNDTDKVRWFAICLLVWNCAALADALAFTFMLASNLENDDICTNKNAYCYQGAKH